MRCDEVRERLVAWDDGELSASEAAQVAAHARRCPSCAAHGEALRAVTPRLPALTVPDAVRRRLEERVDPARIFAAAAQPEATQPWSNRARAFLRREAQVPMPMVVAYAAVLTLAVSAAVVGWWSAPPPVAVAEQPSLVPAEQFEPASFTPAPDPAAPEPPSFR
jgi:anti-sigma factor RsiW